MTQETAVLLVIGALIMTQLTLRGERHGVIAWCVLYIVQLFVIMMNAFVLYKVSQ